MRIDACACKSGVTAGALASRCLDLSMVDVRDPSDWGNQFQWLCRNLKKLNTIFLPALKVAQYYEEAE